MHATSLLAAVAAAVALLACHATAAAAAAAATHTLSDASLTATYNTSAGSLGQLTYLGRAAGGNVVDGGLPAQSVWSASFVGTGVGTASVASLTAKCAGASVSDASAAAVTFHWTECAVEVPVAPSPGKNASWVLHNQSSCSGTCLPEHSSGPHGGNCDRLPGCGHDAGLPYCDVAAMKARCSNVSGCTAFNTNGYLYNGGGAEPFSQYPLECWTLGAPTAPAFVNVTLEIQLTDGQLLYFIAFEGSGTVSLWDYTLAVGQLRLPKAPATLSSSAARQLVGLYDGSVDTTADAVYFAAHDPARVVKSCSVSDKGAGSMSCKVMALNASLPLFGYKAAFPIAVTVTTGDWWDLASIYRAWVLPNAHWTKAGPLDGRTDLPAWLENVTLWMNNNWGGDPLGPNYGGDPQHVQQEMLAVNSVLGLPGHGGILALHWYEWDTLGYALGSNHTKCDRKVGGCGFDTHYPGYFPARVHCKESVKAMQDAGMRVIPYINGQLFDTLIPKWAADNASRAVQKFVAESMRTPTSQPQLTPHLEHFDGITSAVMCPVTDYWHGIMRDTIVQCVNDIGFDGVYVDQVGNGEARNCGDPTHNHTIHGGSFWAEAFYRIMGEVRASVPSSMFMTEGITEEVSGLGFDIQLGLNWAEPAVWHSIYGGYVYATGHAGSIKSPLGGGLCLELTKQFMVGGTMGWFTYQNYGGQFFDPAHAAEVAFIQALSAARIAAKPWMVHGRATRPVSLGDASGALLGGCFLRAKSGEPPSVVCAVAHPARTPAAASYSLAIVPARYGLVVPAGSHVVLSNLETGQSLGTFTGTVTHAASVPALTVQALKLAVVPSA